MTSDDCSVISRRLHATGNGKKWFCTHFLCLCVFSSSVLSFSIQSKTWRFKGRHDIAYEVATTAATISTPFSLQQPHINDDNQRNDDESIATPTVENENADGVPILVLNGFGVGSFHQHRLFRELVQSKDTTGKNKNSQQQKETVVYGIDYLGQGKSWPADCQDGNSANEEGLIYSIDTWTDQVIEWIEDVLLPKYSSSTGKGENEKKEGVVHLVGNSVGGHLAVIIGAKRPDLVVSVCLLNATPVWGLGFLPGWSGHLPPPALPRKVGRYLFDQIRDLNTIEAYLSAAYYNRDAFDSTLVNQIRSCTEGKGGHAAFASILWSPPASFPANDFQSTLASLQCDVLLIFGKNDPWCNPPFAKRMLQSLSTRQDDSLVQRYVELENVGHCPNHEAPRAVGRLVSQWVHANDRNSDNDDSISDSRSNIKLVEGNSEQVSEPWGEIFMREVSPDEAKLSWWDSILTEMV